MSTARDRHPHLRVVDPAGMVPPHALDAEIAVLAALMMKPEHIDAVVGIITPQDFYSAAHALIFEAILDCARKTQTADNVQVAEQLRERGRLDEVGGLKYLVKITGETPAVDSVDKHAREVADRATRRRVIKECQRIAAEGYGELESGQVYAEDAETRLSAIARAGGGDRGEVTELASGIQELFTDIKALAENGQAQAGLPCGFRDVDELVLFEPGDLVIIAARPSIGKTALAMQFATSMASHKDAKDRHRAIYVASAEMRRKDLIKRMICSRASVDSRRLDRGALSETEWARLTEASGAVYGLPLYIDEVLQNPTPGHIRSRAVRLQRSCASRGLALGAVFVDYLQLLNGRGLVDQRASREQEVAACSAAMKRLGGELGVPVFALAQINRGVEKQKDRRPVLADLRESGAIEQDADTILFIHNEEAYLKDATPEEDRGVAEVIVGKQRKGPRATVRLAWKPVFTRFETLAPRYDANDRYGENDR